MLDNICSLPLKADIFTQTIHPTEPLLCVGLSSGHVETYKLPAIDPNAQQLGPPLANGKSKGRARRLSEDGFDTVDSIWRTRRHKGSCRSVAYSLDGKVLFSAGTDGLVKAAEAETGRVTAKIAIPANLSSQSEPDTPSVLCSLSPQALLLGTDTSIVHVFDLRAPSSSLSDKPSQSFRPHDNPDERPSSEAITSITPLPPTQASTSGTSRSWISTSGATLAVTDLRKGVVTMSEDQRDVLWSSTCLPSVAGPTDSLKRNNGANSNASNDRVVVGTMSGNLTIWDRDDWVDRTFNIPLRSKQSLDEEEVEQVTAIPSHVRIGNQSAGTNTVAAGLSDGTISIVQVLPKSGKILGSINHDDRSIDGITTLGFDVAGRMISGGGRLVKIWHEKSTEDGVAGEDEDSDGGIEENASDEGSDEDSESESEEERSKKPQNKRKKRKPNPGNLTHGHHGIMAFTGMD